ncbi:Adaptive-response sensory-kinase SasA [bioreactor metagenome]|jgi:signal transduction histidine kinase|uniref:histidine kinase n=3 Tax=root TaxID=1 RepID=R9C0B6_9CLOT|nr:sensor histidine kinase [Clostridium sartagoforme AAU1]
MLNEKINYKHKCLMSRVFIGTLIGLTFIDLVFKMTDEFIFIIKMLNFSISILIFIMSIVGVNNKQLKILKYVGIGYFYIAIVRFIDLEYIFSINSILGSLSLFQLITYLEVLNMISSIVLFKKGYSPKVQNIVFITITPIIFAFVQAEYSSISSITDVYNAYSAIIANQGILAILFGFLLYYYKKNKVDKNYKWIVDVTLIIVLNNIFVVLEAILNIELTFLIWIAKPISYFLVYAKIEEILISSVYEGAYESLNRAKKVKTNLNKSLKRREKQLKELNLLLEKSEKKYYDVVKALSDGLLLFENDIMVYSNDYKETDYNMVNEIIYDSNKLKLNKILSKITGEEYPDNYDINDFTIEVDTRNEYGENRNLEIDLVKINDNKKILVFNDITEIIKQREEIVKLEKRINDENIKDEFYSNISHELRTPINVIYSALQLNDIYLKSDEVNKINKNNNIIKQNCLRLIRTVNNFIDSNKLSEGFLDIEKSVYNIVDIIENVVLSCDFYMKLRETKLIFDPQYEEIYFYCDKSYIERIMLNILSNSLKYGKYKGNIYVMVKIENNEIIIEVINDAEAIPVDKRIVIFDKFTKINTSLNRPSEGSGLGLFLTRGLVELHDGEIKIDAGIKYGNIFKISFPYDSELKGEVISLNNNIEINELKEKIDIEFSDIYF